MQQIISFKSRGIFYDARDIPSFYATKNSFVDVLHDVLFIEGIHQYVFRLLFHFYIHNIKMISLFELNDKIRGF